MFGNGKKVLGKVDCSFFSKKKWRNYKKIENTYKFPRNGKRSSKKRPNQQAYEEVVPVSSYLSRLRVLRLELCQEVPLLVVELGDLL